MNDQVLVVTRTGVPIERVVQQLEERGLDVVVLDTAGFPERLQVSLRPDGIPVVRQAGEEAVVLDRLRSVWYRRATYTPPSLGNPEVERAVVASSRAFLQGLLASLDVPVLQRKATMDNAARKPRQLALAASVGLDVPATLTTTSAHAIQAFVDAHGGAITKALAGVALSEDEVLMTTPITSDDVAGLTDEELGLCPMTVQEKLYVEREYRVVFVGDAVFAASISSEALGDGAVDWRRQAEEVYTHWRVDPLPEAVVTNLLRLARRLGLHYGAADFIRTQDGRTVFLEINPAGEYAWIDGVFDGAIDGAIADWLAEPA